jgi:threonine aldolase
MKDSKICLASDNYTPAHPLILKSWIEANEGYAPSYGSDPWTLEAEQQIQKAFESDPKVLFIPNGTGANVLGLKIACKRHESVLCSDMAHIYYQECGSAESVVGCKLLPIESHHGKISIEKLRKKLLKETSFGKHSTSPKVLSITQPTEVGTVYTLKELQEISTFCKEHKLLLHIDGSRIYNAIVFLECSLAQMQKAAASDLISLGGTKNGLFGAEALLIFNKSLQEGSDYLHKQTLGLLSKMRYLSCQYIPFFQKNLWHSLASHANQEALHLANLLKSIPSLSISHPVETNQIFVKLTKEKIPLIQEHILCYLWDIDTAEIRLVTSWNTEEKEMRKAYEIFKKIA